MQTFGCDRLRYGTDDEAHYYSEKKPNGRMFNTKGEFFLRNLGDISFCAEISKYSYVLNLNQKMFFYL